MKIYEVIVKKPKITSGFGMRFHPIKKVDKMHYGIDIISKIDDLNIYAMDDGVVEKITTGKDKAKTGYGNSIWIKYKRYNLRCFHAHCSKIYKKVGDKVKNGDIIAKMGKTGGATGVHLHLGTKRLEGSTWLDPTRWDIITGYHLERLLKKGCKGEDVKRLQKDLKQIGYSIGSIDGIFGKKTLEAVKKFQLVNKLNDDGIVGKNTCKALGWIYK